MLAVLLALTRGGTVVGRGARARVGGPVETELAEELVLDAVRDGRGRVGGIIEGTKDDMVADDDEGGSGIT